MELKLSKKEIRDLVEFLLTKINNDEYRIVPREKNILFMHQYRLDQAILKSKVLSKISVDNFVSEEFDNDTIKYGVEKVAIFNVQCELIDFHGVDKSLKVYVKIKEKTDMLIMISVHEAER